MTKQKNIVVQENNADVAASLDFSNREDIEPIETSVEVMKQAEDIQNVKYSQVENLKIPPKIHEVGWNDYVIGQFQENEMEDGRPKVNGLRRLTRKLIGPILRGEANTKQFPMPENGFRATVEYTVEVLNKYQLEEDDEGPYTLIFTDVGDAYPDNMRGPREFSLFLPQNASTRAEVRALRKALNLDVAGVEELTDQPMSERALTGKIENSLITKIDVKCEQLDVNAMKLINLGRPKPDKPLFKNVEELPNEIGVKIFQFLNKCQQNTEKVPDSAKGYDPNWLGTL
jgi:hypothetical protein